MKKESDVAHGEPGDRADFLVAEATLELEMDDLALVARQRVQDVQNLTECRPCVVAFVEVGGHGDLGLVQGREPRRLLACVSREIPADGEQPRGEVVAQSRRVFPAQAQKRFLHDVAGRFQVAQEPSRVADQRPLVEIQCCDYPGGFRCPAHAGLYWR